MPTKPWEKDEATRHSRAGKGGGVNIAVLITLLVAVAVIAVMVIVPPAQWKNLYHSLPSRWEAVRAVLRGEIPGHKELVPLASPIPSSIVPVVTEEQPSLRY